MAGGKHAQKVSCLVCLFDEGQLTPAERIYEGDESDEYKCTKGHQFHMDWADGEADAPQWPPSDDLVKTAAQQSQAGSAS